MAKPPPLDQTTKINGPDQTVTKARPLDLITKSYSLDRTLRLNLGRPINILRSTARIKHKDQMSTVHPKYFFIFWKINFYFLKNTNHDVWHHPHRPINFIFVIFKS